MQVYKSKKIINSQIETLKKQGRQVGFVPTMGALHTGHLSLLAKAKKQNDIAVVSIFVNPLQFNNKNDLKKYPRNIETDIKLLEEAGCDIVFIPSEEEMYPEEVKETFNLGELDKVMEGQFRPGHFQGVAIVVKRLFDIVPAQNAYFGRKDFQQLTIIKHLVETQKIPVNIVACDTIRDNDGLAKSSRNRLLTSQTRTLCAIIPETLFKCKGLKDSKTPEEIYKFVENVFQDHPVLKLEYFEIVEDNTLKKILEWKKSVSYTACIAVWADGVRLIDNISL